MKLIITRHGESIENKKGILSGHRDGKLSDLGIEQSRQLAERLKDEKIDCIYCSDLYRARQTAKEIIKFHPDVSIHYNAGLRETDYRELTGKHKSLFNFMKWSPKVESREALKKRVKNLLDQVYSGHSSETVLFIGHAGSNRALLTVLENKHAHEMQDIRGLTNTAIFVYEVDGSEYKKRIFNSIDHLTAS